MDREILLKLIRWLSVEFGDWTDPNGVSQEYAEELLDEFLTEAGV